MQCYSLEDIQGTIRTEIAENEALAAAWKAVTYSTKKDGKPFAIMAKNFNGATYRRRTYATYSYESELYVNARVGSKYISDSINAYEYAKYIKPEDLRRKKKQNYLDNDIYVLDFEDFKAAIQHRIEKLTENANDLKAQLEKVSVAYEQFASEYQTALSNLKATLGAGDSDYDSQPYILIRDLVQYKLR